MMRFFVNRAIWLDNICKDKNAMYIKVCAGMLTIKEEIK